MKINKPSMISCLACTISRLTSERISRLSESRSAIVSDGDDDASDDCCWDDVVAIDDELLALPDGKQRLMDSWPVSDWNLLLQTYTYNTMQ